MSVASSGQLCIQLAVILQQYSCLTAGIKVENLQLSPDCKRLAYAKRTKSQLYLNHTFSLLLKHSAMQSAFM